MGVIPAKSGYSLPDPIVVFAGGPGQAAGETARLIEAVFSRATNKRDIILIDARGTGLSNPLECKIPEDIDWNDPDAFAAVVKDLSTL